MAVFVTKNVYKCAKCDRTSRKSVARTHIACTFKKFFHAYHTRASLRARVRV